MFTIFHLLSLLGAFFGIFAGAFAGFARFGWLGVPGGAFVGLFIGWLCGKLPFWIVELVIKRQIARQSTAAMWASLHQDDCLLQNFLLRELRNRGEDSREILRFALGMLLSEEREQRLKGLAAFWSAFPDLNDRITDYNPDATDEDRRESVKALQDDLTSGKLFQSPTF